MRNRNALALLVLNLAALLPACNSASPDSFLDNEPRASVDQYEHRLGPWDHHESDEATASIIEESTPIPDERATTLPTVTPVPVNAIKLAPRHGIITDDPGPFGTRMACYASCPGFCVHTDNGWVCGE